MRLREIWSQRQEAMGQQAIERIPAQEIIKIAHQGALDGIHVADLKLDGSDPALTDQFAGSSQDVQFRSFDIYLQEFNLLDAAGPCELIHGHDLSIVHRQRHNASYLQGILVAGGALRAILKRKVE